MAASFVLRQTGQCRFEFTLHTQDGRLLLTSRAYPDKDTALRRINATHSLLRNNKNYFILTAENGLSYFVIKNRKGEVIVRSETFPDAESRQKTKNLVKSVNHGVRLDDRTWEK
jgi:uncharacterized protein YegP (UPF0339 family)